MKMTIPLYLLSGRIIFASVNKRLSHLIDLPNGVLPDTGKRLKIFFPISSPQTQLSSRKKLFSFQLFTENWSNSPVHILVVSPINGVTIGRSNLGLRLNVFGVLCLESDCARLRISTTTTVAEVPL